MNKLIILSSVIIPIIATVILLLSFIIPANAESTIIIKATFTQQAYNPDGWYVNDSVTTIKLDNEQTGRMIFAEGFLPYQFSKIKTITDQELNDNPSILNNYYRVVLTHNEYITHNEYNAIMNHKNVFYIYPNALAVFVNYNSTNNTITKLSVTGNPYSLSKTANTDEFDRCSIKYKIVDYPNGKGLSCYPSYTMLFINPVLRDEIINP